MASLPGKFSPSNGSIYVCNLPYGTDENMLAEYFGTIGLIKDGSVNRTANVVVMYKVSGTTDTRHRLRLYQIEICPLCPCQNRDLYFSQRNDETERKSQGVYLHQHPNELLVEQEKEHHKSTVEHVKEPLGGFNKRNSINQQQKQISAQITTSEDESMQDDEPTQSPNQHKLQNTSNDESMKITSDKSMLARV
ncbi:hypothetical protein Lal_00025270 [Lupinus albus]|nr:hypothetical protein Lal_00025270 [Lupinus albus]